MDLFSILIIAIGLSMDCVAVAVASGLTLGKVRRSDAVKIGVFFGGFQGIMPIIGWLLGLTFITLISGFDHWVAFGLLAFIGGKMIYEAVRGEGEGGGGNPLRLHALLALAIATSIDALAVGLSLSLLEVQILIPAAVTGVVCFCLSSMGALASGRLGALFGSRVKLLGGSILILMGLRILIEHLLG
jgi:putative Mn2+ efflux pump MntP